MTIWSVGLGTGLGATYGGFVVVISMLITTVL
jgi:hypothetical protein